MKKIFAAALVSGLFASSSVFAATITDNVFVSVATAGNNPQVIELEAVAGRAGFVKNDFEVTISANVEAGYKEDIGENVAGVIAGSNKGYVVFTGSSLGGSVSQCGDQDKTGKAAALAVDANLDLDAANGCGR